MCARYINSFRPLRLNVKEEELKEGSPGDLQVQVDKPMGILAKRQLRNEQQIFTKQSSLQRARRVHNKIQEEINRIHGSIANGGTKHKTCEKKLSKGLSSRYTERELETELEKTSLALLQEDNSSSSSISLPKITVKKQKYVRRNSLPVLSSDHPGIPLPPYNVSERLSLPAINCQLPATKAFCKTTQCHSNQKLPPIE